MTYLRQWYDQWKAVIWLCVAVNTAAYATYITQITYATDDYNAIFGPSIGITCGRWLIDFFHTIVFKTNLMPSLMPFLCIASSIFTGFCLCSYWNIKSKSVAAIVILLWSTHPYFFEALNFRFSALAYTLCYALAAGALLLAGRGLKGFFGAILLLCLSLSLYQITIGFAAAVLMIKVLLDCVRTNYSRPAVKAGFNRIMNFAAIAVIALIIYLIITKILFSVFDVNVNPRFSGSFINTKQELFEKTGWTAIMLIVRLLPVPEYVFPVAAKLALFGVYILGLICIVRNRANWLSVLAAIIWLLLIPIAAIAPVLPIELNASDLPWRVCLGIAAFMIGMFVLSQETSSLAIRKAGFGFAILMIITFVMTGNKVFYQQYLCNQKDELTAVQMAVRLQSNPAYYADMPLAVVGTITKKPSFCKEGKTNRQILVGYIRHCTTKTYSFNTSAFETDWAKYTLLLDYLDFDFKPCSDQQLIQTRQWSLQSKPWPDPSSTFIRDGIAVIVLSASDLPD